MAYVNKTENNQLEITEAGVAVKYGEAGDNQYSGFKHQAYYHESGQRDKYVEFHNREQLSKGIYDVNILTAWIKGGIKPRVEYVLNQSLSDQYLKS